MDVKKSEWKTKAIENITQYMTTRGDEDDHLIGNELRNTIGCAMGLLPSIPETEDEIRQAQDGKFCFYKDKSLEAIEVIKKKIYEYTPDKVKVCVLPIEFYSNEKLYELPLFRIVNKSGKYRFIDNCGRYYKSFNDFLEENKLPPGKMMYPRNGHLTPNKDDKNLADCVCDETPSASIKRKAVKVADTGVMIAGIGAGVASIFTGGLAIPIIAGAAAVYGLGRSTYQVVDRAQHDDSLNPFTNSEARMLWLGIAANVASFGAMGASMKLSMMAANGKEITTAFKIVVNSLNGTSLAISSGATLNNVIFMIDNIDKMSPLDITLQCISIAFWAKGAFQFKTAGMIIKDAHNQVFNSITKNLDDNSKANINNFRNDIKNDAQLIRFIRNSKTDPAKTLLALNEMATVYEVLDNGNQRLLSYELLENGMVRLNSGSEVEMSTLLSLNSDHRSIIIEGLYGLDKKQTDAFNKLRAHINDDAKLFQSLAMHNNMKGCTFKESVASLIKFLDNMNQPNGNQNGAGGAGGLVSMKFVKNGQIQLGNKYIFTLDQVKNFEQNHVDVIKNGLLQLNDEQAKSFTKVLNYYGKTPDVLNWISHSSKRYFNVNQIAEAFCLLQNYGLFVSGIEVNLSPNQTAMINGSLSIDLCVLSKLPQDMLADLFKLIAKMNDKIDAISAIVGIDNPGAIVQKLNRLRILFEFQLKEAEQWFKSKCSQKIPVNVKYERLRIRTIQNDILKMETIYPEKFILAVQKFAKHMNATNVSQFGSYSQFVEVYLNYARNIIESTRANDFLEYNKTNVKKMKLKSWSEMIIKQDFENLVNPTRLAKFFNQILEIAKCEKMSLDLEGVSRAVVDKFLDESSLVKAIRTEASNLNIRFGSKISATYHLAKHALIASTSGSFTLSNDQIGKLKSYVLEANKTISNVNSTFKVTISQEGDSRTIIFTNGKNEAVVLESSGSIILCSYR